MINKIKKYWQDSDTQFTFGLSIITFALLFVGYWIREYYNCEGDMFSYSGAIIGGSMTLLGVYLTISFQGRARKEEISLQYKPILKFTYPETEEEKEIKFKHDIIHNAIYFNFKCFVENMGRGEALDMNFFSSNNEEELNIPHLHRLGMVTICNNYEEVYISGIEYSCLPINNKNDLMVQVIISDIYLEYDCFTFYINANFKNAFSKNETLKHSAKIMIRNNKKMNIKAEGSYSIRISNHFE